MVGRSKSRSALRAALTGHQVVAYNFRRAREEHGWTQTQTGEALEPYLGYRLNQAGVSAIEKTFDTDRRRNIGADELIAFSRCFNKPVSWFFLPPEVATDHVVAPVYDEGVGDQFNLDVPDLLTVALGSPSGWRALADRVLAMVQSNGRPIAEALEEVLHARTEHFEEQINLRRSTMQQIELVHQMTPEDEAVIKMANALIELVKLTPQGFLKLRGADPDKALEILAHGDHRVQPFIDDAREKQARSDPGMRGYDFLQPIDPREALGLDDESEQ